MRSYPESMFRNIKFLYKSVGVRTAASGVKDTHTEKAPSNKLQH